MSENRFPRSVTCGEETFELALMTPEDGESVAAFLAKLPAHDLLFLSRDVTNPKVLAAWMSAVRDKRVTSLVLRQGKAVVGCTAIVTEPLAWSRHVGELRVLVAPSTRGKGLGRFLVQECFELALKMGLEKLCVRMTVDQKAAIAAFEGNGFRAEALLLRHVRDSTGKVHDLAILSHDVRTGNALAEAYR